MRTFDRLYALFARKTSGGKFIPEIDGLRFVAIISVLLFHAINHYVDKSNFPPTATGFISGAVAYFGRGVELFFAISGFILALPFASHHLLEKPKPNIKNYFVRRLTRLEPPYILALMLGTFIAYFSSALPREVIKEHFFPSLFYVHNILYPNELPPVNGVTWTLEIEVQFYILAPLLSCLFMIRNKLARRGALIVAVLTMTTANHFIDFETRTLFDYLQFFLVGFVIADLFLDKAPEKGLFREHWLGLLTGITALLAFFYLPADSLWGKLGTIVALFMFFYQVMFTTLLKRMLSIKAISAIGGMCYSIYLLHNIVIPIFDRFFLLKPSANFYVSLSIHLVVLLSIVLFITGTFFLLIEKPCMDKDWVKKLKARLLPSPKA